ncbi:hypothetical protein [Methylocucumis oryzae]|uniref:hypothetical protein n=1 Tax=Methylocucumis oryzae TaxID=1632867 RepID=UPI0006974683|nr:hypothetical protein [Methylocucumis oryzae]
MLLLLTRISRVIALCALSAVSIPVLADDLLTQQRQDFLLAEKLLKQHDDAAFWQVASRLTTYPLYPYLEYQWLQNNLPLTDKVQTFFYCSTVIPVMPCY